MGKKNPKPTSILPFQMLSPKTQWSHRLMEGMCHYTQFCFRLLFSRPEPVKSFLDPGLSKMSWACVMNLGVFAFPLPSLQVKVSVPNTGERGLTHITQETRVQIRSSGRSDSPNPTFGAPGGEQLVSYQMFHLMLSFPGESGADWAQKSSLSVHHFTSQNTIRNHQLASVLWEKKSQIVALMKNIE